MRIRSSKTSPTRSRTSSALLALLTFSIAFFHIGAALTPVPSRDRKVVQRYAIDGRPHGVTIANGRIYVGLADRQAVVAIDATNGAVLREVVLDSADIAATKELVALRTNRDASRLFIANGSDESVTILSIPDLAVVREITIEGEVIRDALPDPAGRYLYVLGRRVHVFDAAGDEELRTLPFENPTAIAVTSNGATLAVIGPHDFGPAKATAVALYNTATFAESEREPLQTEKSIEAALFAAGDRALVALARDSMFEKPVVTAARTAPGGEMVDGRMRMNIRFGDIVNSERICLPADSGPQVAALGARPDHLILAERRCSASGSMAGSNRLVVPASLYGVDAYAVAYDRRTDTVVATEPQAGYLTIFRTPRAASSN